MKKLHSYVPAKVRTAEVCIPSTGNIEEIKQFSCLNIYVCLCLRDCDSSAFCACAFSLCLQGIIWCIKVFGGSFDVAPKVT